MPVNLKLKMKQSWVLYALGSIIFLSLPIFLSPDFALDFHFLSIKGFQRSFISYVLLLLFFYVHHFFLLPKFYFRKSYLTYGLFIGLAFFCCAFLPEFLIKYFAQVGHRPICGQLKMPPINWEQSNHPLHQNKFDFAQRKSPFPFAFLLLQHLVQCALIVFFSFSMAFYARLKKSEQARTEAELAYLKAQINPHFLFNTLNSIYALAIQKDEHTADAVVQLSNMMRYVLTEATKEFVPLAQELEYLADYVGLQSTRLTKNVDFHFEQIGAANDQVIAPMLIVPLIENAFKYGATPDEPCSIYICIEVKGDTLFFIAKNSKVSHLQVGQKSSKMGLTNVRKRLEAVYPMTSQLTIIDDTHLFIVTLSIQLK